MRVKTHEKSKNTNIRTNKTYKWRDCYLCYNNYFQIHSQQNLLSFKMWQVIPDFCSVNIQQIFECQRNLCTVPGIYSAFFCHWGCLCQVRNAPLFPTIADVTNRPWHPLLVILHVPENSSHQSHRKHLNTNQVSTQGKKKVYIYTLL